MDIKNMWETVLSGTFYAFISIAGINSKDALQGWTKVRKMVQAGPK